VAIKSEADQVTELSRHRRMTLGYDEKFDFRPSAEARFQPSAELALGLIDEICGNAIER